MTDLHAGHQCVQATTGHRPLRSSVPSGLFHTFSKFPRGRPLGLCCQSAGLVLGALLDLHPEPG